ncbi:MAG: hypothetical protein DSY55_06680 [Clostridia bacterium]|nr:MAG: hypothetical protein DSY55_06680 [Clostridia bacterium]
MHIMTEASRKTLCILFTSQRGILLLLLAYLLLGIIYSFATPVFEASDEMWHYAVVREIVTHHRLPVQRPGVPTTWEHEGSQPPLYYFLGALLTAGVDINDYEDVHVLNPFSHMGIPKTTNNVNMVLHLPGQTPWRGGTSLAVYLIRWFSLLLGAGTVYFSYRLSHTLSPGNESRALLTAGLVAFNPMALFINASVNNDNLIILLSTITLWMIATEMLDKTRGPHWRRTILLSALIGLAMITKISGAILLPTAALALTFRAWKQRAWGDWVRRGVVMGLIVAVIAGWWYVRNWMLYGDWLGMKQWVLITGPRPPEFVPTDLLKEGTSFLYGYWGVFGGFNLLSPAWFFGLMRMLAVLAFAGLLVKLARRMFAWKTTLGLTHLTMASYLLLTMIGFIRLTLLFPTTQGRLIFSGLSIIAFYTATGLQAWIPQRLRSQGSLLLLGTLFFSAAIIPFVTIRPAYRPPAPILALPADTAPLDARFANGIHLLGYKLKHHAIEAGQPLDITLYWQTDRVLHENDGLSLNGWGYHEENIAKLDTWPGGGTLPTSIWQVGKIYPDHYLIKTLPNADTPTLIKLSVQLSEDTHGHGLGKQIAAFGNGSPVDAIMLDAGDLLTPADRITPPPQPPLALFEQGVELNAQTTHISGNTLTVRLTWSTTGPVAGDYTVFTHLLDSQGAQISQSDAPPRDGYWPTSHWRPNEAITSTHRLPLPETLSDGEYTLLVGMYNSKSDQRLAVHKVDGPDLPDRALPLSVQIAP